jgi:hypothetical protein
VQFGKRKDFSANTLSSLNGRGSNWIIPLKFEEKSFDRMRHSFRINRNLRRQRERESEYVKRIDA